MRRVQISGLVTGLVLNVGEALLHGVVLAQPTAAAMTALGRSATGSGTGIGVLVALTFVQGYVCMWLYAAGLPGWKRGVPLAVGVGLLVWLLSTVYSAIYLSSGLPGLLPTGVVWWPVAWGLIEFPMAVVLGAMLFERRGRRERADVR